VLETGIYSVCVRCDETALEGPTREPFHSSWYIAFNYAIPQLAIAVIWRFVRRNSKLRPSPLCIRRERSVTGPKVL